jgi:hypothetical protein
VNKLEQFLEKEWNKDKGLSRIYEDFEEYKNFMFETVEQYKELGQMVKKFKGTLSEFKDTLEFGYTNYEENKYVDFNYGNLCATVCVENDKLLLHYNVEVWNDGKGTFEYALFDIRDYLI